MYRYFLNKIPPYFLRKVVFMAIFIFGTAFPQTKTNLEVFYSLSDSLVSHIAERIPQNNDKILLKLNLGDTYSIFSNYIKNAFIKKGKEIFKNNPDGLNILEINIIMEEAGVEYGEMDRDGLFGDYYTTRTLYIDGNYLNTFSKEGLQEYHLTAIDTIKVDNIKLLENDSFPFTKGKIPPEPFFSSLWEPVIAIGVAAAAIILFFSVRNK